ncbi:MAG: hypothetical protein BWY74_01831 [Firmicutes bacterium ADurb.Bin419]|nr:MAG: hypothetical protein BWY74_01831 [Firmicutes bacterium ADurb.Bin419]
MYRFEHCELRKLNISTKLSEKQSMNFECIHWINPLFYKCGEMLYPDNIS